MDCRASGAARISSFNSKTRMFVIMFWVCGGPPRIQWTQDSQGPSVQKDSKDSRLWNAIFGNCFNLVIIFKICWSGSPSKVVAKFKSAYPSFGNGQRIPKIKKPVTNNSTASFLTAFAVMLIFFVSKAPELCRLALGFSGAAMSTAPPYF